MKSLNDNQFFNLLARLQMKTNPSAATDQWKVDGVIWERERHSHWGRDYAFQVECQLLTSEQPHRWRLLVVTEKWWDSNRSAQARLSQWSKLSSGDRKKVLDWFKGQAKRLDSET